MSNIYQYQIYVLFKGSVSDPSGGGASAVKQCESKFDPSLDFQAALHACKVHKQFERQIQLRIEEKKNNKIKKTLIFSSYSLSLPSFLVHKQFARQI